MTNIKKRKIGLSIAVISVLIILATNLAFAKDEYSPLSQLWDAITGLQTQIDSIELIPGPQGPQGEQGPIGPEGPQGEQGEIDTTIISTLEAKIADLETRVAQLEQVVTQAPVAIASGSYPHFEGYPYLGYAGEPVVFSGVHSYDNDGVIVSYEWKYGDGDIGYGVSPSHTYTEDGEYTVTLTVTDDDGETDTAITTAEIEPMLDGSAPIPVIAEPIEPVPWFDDLGNFGFWNVTLDGTSSYDIDGTIISYEWRLDFEPHVGLDLINDEYYLGDYVVVEPSASADGVLAYVTLSVTDNDGNTRSAYTELYFPKIE